MTEAASSNRQGGADNKRLAAARYEEAARHWRTLGSGLEEARCKLALGTINLALGQPEPARELYQQALDLFTELAEEPGRRRHGAAPASRARHWAIRPAPPWRSGSPWRSSATDGEPAAALSELARALDLARRLEDRLGEISALLREPEKLPGFVSSMARNLFLGAIRLSGRRQKWYGDAEATETAPDPAPGQLTKLLAQERAAAVRRVLGELKNDRDREILSRYYIADENKEDICREETANDFREGMRQVAAEDIAQPPRSASGSVWALAALSLRHRLALASALLLLIALPSLWLAQRNRGLQQQLAAATAGTEHQRAALEARVQSLEEARAGDRRRLEEELARELQARETTAQTLQPQVNVPLFLLAAVRSGGQEDREPVNQILLSPTDGQVILTAELATVDFPSYRASLHTAGGREVWQAQSLHPDSRDTLVLLLPASMLQPGVYRLTIEGAKKGGEWFTVGGYPFRVVRRLPGSSSNDGTRE
jgi:hypothetical protein